jgi:hypothetical protein
MEVELVSGFRRREELVQKLESVQVRLRRLERRMQHVSSEGWKIAAVRQCRTLMKRRMENRCPLQHCQFELDSFRMEITSDSIGWPYLDMPRPTRFRFRAITNGTCPPKPNTGIELLRPSLEASEAAPLRLGHLVRKGLVTKPGGPKNERRISVVYKNLSIGS